MVTPLPLDPALESMMEDTDDGNQYLLNSGKTVQKRPSCAKEEATKTKKKAVAKAQNNAKTKKVKKTAKKQAGDNEDNTKNKTDGGDSNDEEDSKKRTRARNYHEDEDLQLCTSWLKTTEDGRKETDQTGNAFWSTVAKHYSKHMPDPEQSAKSLKNRWGIIQQAVNKFHGCVQQINHWNLRGTSSTNRNSMAVTFYSKLQGKPFTFTACYEVLRKSAKWHDYCLALEKKSKPKKPATNVPSSPTPGLIPSSNSGLAIIKLDSDGSGNETTRTLPERAIGQKKSKVAYQDQQLELSNHKHLKKMALAHSEIANVAKKQQETLKWQNHNLQRLANKAIMNKDLTGESKVVRKFYEMEQKKIMAWLEGEMEKVAKS
ncbi:hypothetical protein PCASD_11395 [Puccinia coronata f. sp. avenae]|uniref:No apical meristem-associated C-terminal domain-containing protein n=1 Tax=Puccinia coronata f. sp. avenae TaxID=200324 RepID=A0A2N5TDL6_9BASI|nr:hypothetical protein PCASD_11395 [Puccinia coronata f. sp. avenae]